MWIAAIIGNSRIHWAQFLDHDLGQVWHTPHLAALTIAQLSKTRFDFTAEHGPDLDWHPSSTDPLWLVSVVPEQTALLQPHLPLYQVTRDQIPLRGLYPTLGIDRAIALLGAVTLGGAPVLVIDAGTALTFTGIDAARTLVGGAIAPGLGLMARSLHADTAALPQIALGEPAPRWALNTPDAIRSGVMYTAGATLSDFVETWQTQYPNSMIALTGGDSDLLLAHLHQHQPAIAQSITHLPNLIFAGVAALRQTQML